MPAWLRRRFRVLIFYDGWCVLCRRAITTLRRLDILGLLEPVSFRDPGVLERFGLDPRRAAARLQAVAAIAASPVEGIEAVILIATRLPPAWPAVPLLWAATRLGLGQRVYDWIAARRTIIPSGHSDGESSPDARRGAESRGEP